MTPRLFRTSIFLLALSFFLCGFGPGHSSAPETKNSGFFSGQSLRFNQAYGQLPLAFEPNQGHADPQVKFLARGSGYTLFVTSQEAVLSLKQNRVLPLDGKSIRPQDSHAPASDAVSLTVLRLKLEGAQSVPVFESSDQLPGISNYFIGKDPAQWHTNIPQYSKVAMPGLYPGVDMVYYGNQGTLEYDFVVAPGADPSVIHMRVDGAKASK